MLIYHHDNLKQLICTHKISYKNSLRKISKIIEIWIDLTSFFFFINLRE